MAVDGEAADRRLAGAVALASLAVGLVLRLWGLGQGYPEFYGDVDEIGVAASVWNFFRAGTLRPTEFTYPALFSYLTAACVWLSGALGLLGRAGGLRDSLVLASYLDPAWAALAGRSLSAVLGAASIALTYWLGRQAYGARVGAIAAGFMALAALPVERAHMALPDSTMAFLAAACFCGCWRVWRWGRRRDYAVAGICAGWVVAAKYNGAFTACALGAAHLLRCRREGASVARCAWSPRWWGAALLAVVALVAGSPYLLLAWRQYAGLAQYQVSSLDFALHPTHPWWWVVSGLVRTEAVVGVLMLAGLAWSAWQRRPLDWMLLAAWVPSFLYIGSWTRESLHYLLHFYPLLAIGAARLVEAAAARGRRLAGTSAAAYGLAALVVLPSARGAVAGALELAKTDTRARAAAWIEAHVPDGSRLGMTWLPYCPRVPLAGARRALEERYRNDPAAQARLREAWRGRPAYELVNLEAWLKEPLVPAPYAGRVDLDDPETRRVFSRVWLGPEQLRERGVDYLVLPEAIYGRYLQGPEPPEGTAAAYHFAKNRLYFSQLTDRANPRVRTVATLAPGPDARGGAIHILRLQP